MKDFIGDVRKELLAAFEAVYFPDLLGDLPGRHATSVHRDDLLVDPGNVLLALFHDPGLETAVSVLRNIELKFAVIAADFFLFSAVTIIQIIAPLTFLISEVFVHLRFHHGLDRATQQILQSCLDIICCFDIVFILFYHEGLSILLYFTEFLSHSLAIMYEDRLPD